MMPSAEQYRRLFAQLTEAKKRFDEADDDKGRLIQGYTALERVIAYLLKDAELRDAGLIRPLGFVDKALFNAACGAKPPELDHAPDGPKPTGTTREYVQVAFAWALELLAEAGMGTGHAARWVAKQARKMGVSDPNGSAVHWERIVQWRKDLRRGAASATERASWASWRQKGSPHEALLKMPRSDPQKRANSERAVRVMFRTLADTDPRGAPSARSK